MFRRIWKNEDGQAMVEYGLLIALIAIAVIATVFLLGGGIKGIFEKAVDGLDGTIAAG